MHIGSLPCVRLLIDPDKLEASGYGLVLGRGGCVLADTERDGGLLHLGRE
jgi:hypothetical protein